MSSSSHISSNTPRVKRQFLNESQKQILLQSYTANSYPSITEIQRIGQIIQCSEAKVKYWFSNRRRSERHRSCQIQSSSTQENVSTTPITISSIPVYSSTSFDSLMLSSHAMQPPLSNYSPLAQYPMPYAPLSNLPVNSPFVNPYQMYPSNCQCYDCSVAVSQSMWLPPPI